MTALILLAILLILIGVSGTLLPALPGLPFLFAGTWLLAYSQDYLVIGSFSVLIVGVICAFGMAMDFMAGVLGAKYTGASKEALWGGGHRRRGGHILQHSRHDFRAAFGCGSR